MTKKIELISKVAKNYLRDKLLPTLALATGLNGCAADMPVVPPDLSSPVKINRTLDPMLSSALETLKAIEKEVKRITFKDAEDVKSKRMHYFSLIRSLVDDPIQVKYQQLPDNDKSRLKNRKTLIDTSIRETEKVVGDVLDEAYLKFKPWHRSRFENRKI